MKQKRENKKDGTALFLSLIHISEIMLQQTRVAAVLGYYARFLAVFPTVAALAEADEELLMKLWEGLGYYSRARNLQKAAQEITALGGFPDTYDGLLAPIAIVVSEETGRISVAIKGQFHLRLSAEQLESILTRELDF